MLTGIIIAVIALIGALVINIDEARDMDESIVGAVFKSVFFSLAMGVILGTIVASFIGIFFKTTDSTDTITPIVALQNKQGVQGSFFLGTGSVDSTEYYYYLAQQSGGVTLSKIDSDGVIVYQDNQPPAIVTFTADFVNPHAYLWAISWHESPTVIHIPKDSIIENYSVDLSK